MLTATFKARIVKPLDGDWDKLGDQLRALQAPLHRVLTVAVSRVELADRFVAEGQTAQQIAQHFDLPLKILQAPKPRKRKEGQVPAREITPETVAFNETLSYRFVSQAWEIERKKAAEKFTVLAEKLAEAEAGLVLNTADAETANRVCELKRGVRYYRNIAETQPSASVLSGAAAHVMRHWAKWDKERWWGTVTLPTFKKKSPIYLVATNGAIRLEPRDGKAVLSVRLTLGNYTRLILTVDDGAAHARLRKMLEHPEIVRDAKIVYNKPKRRWLVYLTCKVEPRAPSGTRTMALHRGMACLLTAAIARSAVGLSDAKSLVLETGEDILQHKNAYYARRRSLGQQLRQLGRGGQGHGCTRRRECSTKLQDTEARYVLTKCQEVAAHAIRLALRNDVTRILVEDWTCPSDTAPWFVQRWPWAQLLTCIKWAATKAGLVVESQKTDYNSVTCPLCGMVGTVKDRTFFCANPKCRLERNRDMVFAWNMLKRDGHKVPLKEAKEAAQKVKRKLQCAMKELNTDELDTYDVPAS